MSRAIGRSGVAAAASTEVCHANSSASNFALFAQQTVQWEACVLPSGGLPGNGTAVEPSAVQNSTVGPCAACRGYAASGQSAWSAAATSATQKARVFRMGRKCTRPSLYQKCAVGVITSSPRLVPDLSDGQAVARVPKGSEALPICQQLRPDRNFARRCERAPGIVDLAGRNQ